MTTSNQQVMLYDTTLRDGAQAEGISFTLPGKLALAQRLDEFGIDYIEGGFPGSNPKDISFFEAFKEGSAVLKQARLVAFGSTRRAGTAPAGDAGLVKLLEAETPTVAVFGKAWPLHVRDILHVSKKENLEMIRESIVFCKQHGRETFFDAEHFFDGYKADATYAVECLRVAVEAGADALVLCDTNGGSLPYDIHAITREVGKRFGVQIGIHAHNDAGLAVANSLEAVRAGACQVQGTMNGYGERSGNANLCSIVPSLMLKMKRRCLRDPQKLGELRSLSLFVDELVDRRHDTKAPYVGASAFAHKGGMHVNAVKKNPLSFEHIDPAHVGNRRRILVSEGSGVSSVLLKAAELGVDLSAAAKESRGVLEAVKEMENKGYAFEAAEASFKILVQKELKQHTPFFELEGFRVIIEKRGKNEACISEASIKVRVGEDIEHTVADGDGPVNALDGALRKALTRFYPMISSVTLSDFHVRILDPEEATAATTRVLIESTDGRESWRTVGVSPNIIEASWEALADSVHYKLFREEEKNGTEQEV